MVRAGELSINPAWVATMEWDRRHYANGPGDSDLVVTMYDGAKHRIKHEPYYLDGVDAYAVEAAITAAIRPLSDTEEADHDEGR